MLKQDNLQAATGGECPSPGRILPKAVAGGRPGATAGVGLDRRCLDLEVHPRAIALPLLLVLLAMTAIVLVLPVVADMAGRNPQAALPRSLDFRAEANIPTMFSTAMLLLAAVLLFVHGRAAARVDGDRTMSLSWQGLALIFAFLAVDETAMIHEGLNKLHVPVSGPLAFIDKFPWVWFYTPAAAAVGLLYLPFLGRLPRGTAAAFVAAGAIFVFGAIGLELLGAWAVDVHGVPRDGLFYVLRGTAEEFCEMFGVLLFVWALLRHLAERGLRLRLTFVGGRGNG